MNWDYGSLPPCSTYESEHQVAFPYVGANCNDKPKGLMQVNDDPIHGPSKPPGGFPWTAWDADTLPSCHKWRNAHEVPYPMVGSNCVNRDGKQAALM